MNYICEAVGEIKEESGSMMLSLNLIIKIRRNIFKGDIRPISLRNYQANNYSISI